MFCRLSRWAWTATRMKKYLILFLMLLSTQAFAVGGTSGTGAGTSLTASGGGGSVSVTAGSGNIVVNPSPGTGTFTIDSSTSPTYGTSVTTPLVIGGTTSSSTLTLESTSGAGTTDAIIFNAGSQSEKMRITSAGLVGIGTNVPNAIISLNGQSAQTINMVRDTTTSTAGQNLTIQAGGATPASTNLAGGSLILSAGVGTGTSLTPVVLQVYGNTANGTADALPLTIMTETRNNTASTAQTRVDITFSPNVGNANANFTHSSDSNQNARYLGKLGGQGAYIAGGNDANAYIGAASTGTLFFGAAGNTNTNFMQMTSANLAIGTTTAVTGSSLTLAGHIGFALTAIPVVSTCGSGTLTAGSTDNKGQITGITAATACTITFSSALPAAPSCVFSTSTGIASGPSTISTAAVTTTMAALTGSLYYLCQ